MNSTALVTGASRGIGLGIATRLAEKGYGLTITARNQAALEVVARELESVGAPQVVAVAGDLAEDAHPERLVCAHRDAFTSMDALVLNAGVGTAGAIVEFPMRRFDKSVGVNLRAPFDLIQQSIPLLRSAAMQNPRRGSKVVTVASITGVYAEAGLAVYGATKAALVSLTETLNVEESANGISATALAPAYVDTDMSAWVHDRIPAEAMIEVGDMVELVDALLRLSARAVVPKIVVSRAGTTGYGA